MSMYENEWLLNPIFVYLRCIMLELFWDRYWMGMSLHEQVRCEHECNFNKYLAKYKNPYWNCMLIRTAHYSEI